MVSFKRRVWVPIATAVAVVAATAAPATAAQGGLLDRALAAVHAAGMPGVYAEVRDGRRTWQGASGVADTATGRPVRPDFEHRAGSTTKTFVATGVLQQVAAGRIDLDAPIARYLPGLVKDERGRKVTVRMLLNHTSRIADYVSIGGLWATTDDIYRTRLTSYAPERLAEIGLNLPPLPGEPGSEHSYSNTNYAILGLLLAKVTGQPVRDYLTRNVIRAAGIGRTTYFPGNDPVIRGPHSRAYDSMYGTWNPPKDFSVTNMSWAGTAGEIVSTVDDLNRFYRALLQGRLLPPALLAEMKKPGTADTTYGLGIFSLPIPGCGTFWGHDGGAFGMGTYAFSTEDGTRQIAIGINMHKYQQIGPDGQIQQHAIDRAIGGLIRAGLCPSSPATELPLDGVRG
ncbi:D-alanyl-D-alanine carboxypeptidase [Actinocrispum wychmicini]|uniref:D-alanyl-D-alanine carboxypeptidase n=2 Tax=Actinocrispum wychmicini TaxID=1213861 RepID=A0A4R2JJX7_9PSEU|nr:D-alanyl-D-alanine carboxypeptidase [Actinocrispum wychmicini]